MRPGFLPLSDYQQKHFWAKMHPTKPKEPSGKCHFSDGAEYVKQNTDIKEKPALAYVILF
jgi:hypothetical protein